MKHVTIIGLGLIGGSLARALYAQGYAITGIDTDEANSALCKEDGVIQQSFTELVPQALQTCDALIIATPPDSWHALAATMQGLALHHVQLIMDVGSIKEYAQDCFGRYPQCVPAHPIAGSEFSGGAYADAALFAKKRVILCAKQGRAKELATLLWEQVGASCHSMSAAKHDMVYATISHLPQFVAYAAAPALMTYAQHNDAMLGALRLAGSSPDLWLGIFRHNAALSESVEHYLQLLTHMIAELRTGEEGGALNMQEGALCCPRIIASCLISAVTIAERKQDMRMASYAGSGFADMSAPAMTDPQEDLARISTHAQAVVSLLEQIEQRLRAMLVAYKREEWDVLHGMMLEAQQRYASQLH